MSIIVIYFNLYPLVVTIIYSINLPLVFAYSDCATNSVKITSLYILRIDMFFWGRCVSTICFGAQSHPNLSNRFGYNIYA